MSANSNGGLNEGDHLPKHPEPTTIGRVDSRGSLGPQPESRNGQLYYTSYPSVIPRPSRLPRAGSALYGLAIGGVIIAILILITGISCTTVGRITHPFTFNCEAGTGIWEGLFGIVTSSIGVAAVTRPNGRCLLIAYQVLQQGMVLSFYILD